MSREERWCELRDIDTCGEEHLEVNGEMSVEVL